jgi:glycosyltransferase involved in cell wall biosynthesis
LGYGVAAPHASGAQEYVRDIVSFGLTQTRDVQIAVKIAIGRPASVRAVPQPLPAPAMPVPPVAADDLPLVSIIVGTYNRPADLENCLRDLAKQTYPRIEIVVVNDAGENVDHIVARYPQARIVNLPVNGGVLRLIVEGFKNVTGAYVQLLADDDTLYPDHVERLMAAMLNAGARVAHGNTLIRYQQRNANGELSLSGFNALAFNDSTTPSEALLATPVAGQSIIIRRDIIDEIGGYSLDTALADQEFQLRAAARYVFAWVDAVTSEWRVRGGSENYSSRTDNEAEMRKLYEELHPVPDRPYIEHRRQKALEAFAERPKGFIFAPSVLVEGAVPAGTGPA